MGHDTEQLPVKQDVWYADHVEIRIDTTGKLWVNVNGVCALRIGLAREFKIIDERKSNEAA